MCLGVVDRMHIQVNHQEGTFKLKVDLRNISDYLRVFQMGGIFHEF